MFNFFESIFIEAIRVVGVVLGGFLVLIGANYVELGKINRPTEIVEETIPEILEAERDEQKKIYELDSEKVIQKEETAKDSIKEVLEKETERKSEAITQKQVFSIIPEKKLNEKTRASLVNILCLTRRNGSLDSLSGSGVIIDPRGVIITNAHVAEFFLLEDYLTENNIDCVIRMGEPARPLYKAALLNISKEWVEETASTIRKSERTGTGENDYALLLITSNINGQSIPNETVFPYLEVDTDFIAYANYPVFLAGYPAEFLGEITIQRDFWPVSSSVEIKSSYYFSEEGKEKPDLLGLGGSVVAQAGASGGAVVDSYTGKLVAVIVTTSEAKTTGDRDLNGATLNHINRAMAKSIGKNLREFLSQNLKEELNRFQRDNFGTLKNLLVKELERR